jgi:hypothetical protein
MSSSINTDAWFSGRPNQYPAHPLRGATSNKIIMNLTRARIGQVLQLKPVILAIQEVKIRRIKVQGQPGEKTQETTSQPIKSLAC